ncbi:Mediator of RNA polymerase II transcription subunit 21 [Rhinocladiella similis]
MSTDILTQLQTTYDQLLTQFFSTISYLSQRHPLVAPEPDPSDPYTNPPAQIQTPNPDGGGIAQQTSGGLLPGPEDTDRSVYPLRPSAPNVFASAQRELAEDLVTKAQQIEFLISRLPGIGRDEEDQAREIQELVKKVRQMEVRRKEKRKEMRECVRKLDSVVLGMAQSVGYEEDADASHANGTAAGG